MGYDVEYLERLYMLFQSGKAKVNTEVSLNVDKITVGNIKVGSTDQSGGNKYLKTDAQGRLILHDSLITIGDSVIQETDIATISSGNTDTVLSRTVTGGRTWYIRSFSGGGEGDGEVSLEIDGTSKASRQFLAGTSVQHIFSTAVPASSTSVITVKIANGAPSSAQFTADLNAFWVMN